MSNLKELIFEFERHLKESNAAILKKLQDGLTNDYISVLLSNIDMSDAEISTLYSWKNGIQYDSDWVAGELDFFSFGVMLSLEDALKHQGFLIKSTSINKFLLPIFTTGGGDYILYQADTGSDGFGRLLLYAPMLVLSENPMSIYDSLETFFQTINECYRSGAYKFSGEGTLEINYELEQKISKNLNSNAEYWE